MSIKNKEVYLVFGTRPEAIKMAPVYWALRDRGITARIVLTGQHKEMLSQVIELFELPVDFNFSVMKENQTLEYITSEVLLKLSNLFKEKKPAMVLVHGDTTTTFSAALAAFYYKIPVGHVEAGLRTNDIYSPFPEEINRRLVDQLSSYYFAPTRKNKEKLLREGIPEDKIYVTGNTVIDAFLKIAAVSFSFWDYFSFLDKNKKIITLTAHRRENFGEKMERIFLVIRKIIEDNPDLQLVYPVHLNPNVKKMAEKIFLNHARIHLISPQPYLEFVHLLKNSYFVLTDSGGIQEEVPSLGIPVFVLRDVTERKEAVESGTVELVGTEPANILEKVNKLLKNDNYFDSFRKARNPYGDGKASHRIAEIVEKELRSQY